MCPIPTLRLLMCLSLLTVLAAGCSDLVPGTDANLEARLDAARQISNPTLADTTLAKLAKDAAFVGNTEVAADSVEGIKAVSLHDQTAYDSAILLARNGARDDAVELARMIGKPDMRDDVLRKLAEPLAP